MSSSSLRPLLPKPLPGVPAPRAPRKRDPDPIELTPKDPTPTLDHELPIYVSELPVLCNQCNVIMDGPCIRHGKMYSDSPPLPLAFYSVPEELCIKSVSGLRDVYVKGVFAKQPIDKLAIFGPLVCPMSPQMKLPSGRFSIKSLIGWRDCQLESDQLCNWMKFVRPANYKNEQNIMAFEQSGGIYFCALFDIEPDQELRFWYSKVYGSILGKPELTLLPEKDARNKKGSAKDETNLLDAPLENDVVFPVKQPKRRGRPKKISVDSGENTLFSDTMNDSSLRSKILSSFVPSSDETEPPPKKKRGRKPKAVLNDLSEPHLTDRGLLSSALPGDEIPGEMMEAFTVGNTLIPDSEFVNEEPSHARESSIPFDEIKTEDDYEGRGCHTTVDDSGDVARNSLEAEHFADEEAHECSSSDEPDEDALPADPTESNLSPELLAQKYGNKTIRLRKDGKVDKRSLPLRPEKIVRWSFTCDQCPGRFRSKEWLNLHAVSHGAPFPELESLSAIWCCRVCKGIRTDREALLAHVEYRHKRVLSSRATEFRCQPCNRYYNTQKRLDNHLKVFHSGPAEKKFECDVCHERFLTKKGMNSHKKAHQFAAGDFRCIICLKKFDSAQAQRDHAVEHCQDGMYPCRLCGNEKSYTTMRHLTLHFRTYHAPLQTCEICGYSARRRGFEKHMLMHSSEFPHKCDICGRQFKRLKNFEGHMKRYHDPAKPKMPKSLLKPDGVKRPRQMEDYRAYTYKCTDCKLGFHRSELLIRHVEQRHPDRSILSIPELNLPTVKAVKYECSFCKKLFVSIERRKAHLEKEHSEAVAADEAGTTPLPPQRDVPYVAFFCATCDMQFNSASRLIEHSRNRHPETLPEELRRESSEE